MRERKMERRRERKGEVEGTDGDPSGRVVDGEGLSRLGLHPLTVDVRLVTEQRRVLAGRYTANE